MNIIYIRIGTFCLELNENALGCMPSKQYHHIWEVIADAIKRAGPYDEIKIER